VYFDPVVVYNQNMYRDIPQDIYRFIPPGFPDIEGSLDAAVSFSAWEYRRDVTIWMEILPQIQLIRSLAESHPPPVYWDGGDTFQFGFDINPGLRMSIAMLPYAREVCRLSRERVAGGYEPVYGFDIKHRRGGSFVDRMYYPVMYDRSLEWNGKRVLELLSDSDVIVSPISGLDMQSTTIDNAFFTRSAILHLDCDALYESIRDDFASLWN